MELFVIRHAIAEPLGKENEFSDEKRVLTAEGRHRMREVVKGLAKLGIEIDLILSSPLARSVETAEIIAAAVGLSKKDIKQTSNLEPGASVDGLFAEIKGLAGVEAIVLVGHQPDLGGLIARIINGDGGALSIQLKKGSVCCLNVSETVPALRGDMMWLLTPRQLRLLAKT
jgi:phosphohistidine phosphatase